MRRWVDNIKMLFGETNWIQPVKDKKCVRILVNTEIHSRLYT
jgi:hypothetical protein